MSLDDLRAIDWKHVDIKSLPHYMQLSFALILLGLLLLLAGLLF